MKNSIRRAAGILVLSPALLGAQARNDSPIRKGTVQVAGTAAFYHDRDIGNDNGWTLFELMPRVGYFVTRGLAVSANLQFRKVWGEDQRSTAWGVGPGLTYYFTTPARRFYPFVSARSLFTRTRSHVDEHTFDNGITLPPSTSTGFTDSWLLSAGGLFMISRQVGISTELFYQHDKFGFDKSWNSSEMY